MGASCQTQPAVHRILCNSCTRKVGAAPTEVTATTPFKCDKDCSSELAAARFKDKSEQCWRGDNSHEYAVLGAEYRYFDDEVKPAQWGLSEYEQWQEEMGLEVPHHKAIIAQWREFRDLYKLQEQLKVGSYGTCNKAYCKTLGVPRVVKHLHKVEEKKLQIALTEARLMRTLDHPNILNLVETVEDNVHFYLVMDLCEGGALSECMQDDFHFTDLQVLQLMRQILSAISYLHALRIVHRDLKLENVLMASKDPVETVLVKLIDFRTSAEIQPDGYLTDKVTTPLYAAPEVLSERYTEKIDEWCCGIMMYVLLCGYYPFQARTPADLQSKIYNGNFSTHDKLWDHVSESAKSLVRGLLTYKYRERLSADEALRSEAIRTKTPAVQWV